MPSDELKPEAENEQKHEGSKTEVELRDVVIRP